MTRALHGITATSVFGNVILGSGLAGNEPRVVNDQGRMTSPLGLFTKSTPVPPTDAGLGLVNTMLHIFSASGWRRQTSTRCHSKAALALR